jgi:small nuclear ribonucleoprotein (snRNP)-like protein
MRMNKETKMKRMIALAIVISLLLPPTTMFGKERRGAIIEITKTDGTKIGGELIGVKQNGRLILEAAEEIDASDILIVTIIGKSRAKAGGILGAIIGIPLGVVAWTNIHGNDVGVPYEKTLAFLGAVGGTTFLGFLVGAFIGSDSIIRMEGIPQKEKDKNLEELRSKARFPDYQ